MTGDYRAPMAEVSTSPEKKKTEREEEEEKRKERKKREKREKRKRKKKRERNIGLIFLFSGGLVSLILFGLEFFFFSWISSEL